LLKSEGRTSKDVGKIVDMSHVSFNSWLSRYKSEGIRGLLTKEGRGRKPKIDNKKDVVAILEAVKANRQRLQIAKAEWEVNSGKSMGRNTFRSFLKVLADDIKE
jgi:transposase